MIKNSYNRIKFTKEIYRKIYAKKQNNSYFIPIETASISEKSNDKAFSSSSEAKLNTKTSDYYCKKIMHNKNINIGLFHPVTTIIIV